MNCLHQDPIAFIFNYESFRIVGEKCTEQRDLGQTLYLISAIL